MDIAVFDATPAREGRAITQRRRVPVEAVALKREDDIRRCKIEVHGAATILPRGHLTRDRIVLKPARL